MSLIRKKGSPFWWYDFTYQGKRCRKSTEQKTRAAAAVVEATTLQRLSIGVEVPKSAKTPTLREFSVRFKNWSENSIALAPDSKKFYAYGLRLLLFTRLADTPMDRLTGEIVECTPFIRHVIDRKTRLDTGRTEPCSPTYTNQALRTLKAVIGKAIDWEVIRHRPTFSMAKAQGRDRLIDHDAEIKLEQQFGAKVGHPRIDRQRLQAWIVMVILQDTGMRPDEVFPMRIDDIRWQESRIWVPKGKTANARRFVGMSERMVELLKPWCQGRTDWVFPSPRSASGHLEGIAKGFQRARKGAGLDSKIVPYSARHTYATHQMQATGNTFAVSKSMGHAGVKSMEPYQHPDTSMLNVSINARNRDRDLHQIESAARHTPRHTGDLIM